MFPDCAAGKTERSCRVPLVGMTTRMPPPLFAPKGLADEFVVKKKCQCGIATAGVPPPPPPPDEPEELAGTRPIARGLGDHEAGDGVRCHARRACTGNEGSDSSVHESAPG